MIIPGIFTDLKLFQPHYFWRSSSLILQLEEISHSPEIPKALSFKSQLKCHLLEDTVSHLLARATKQGHVLGQIPD